VRTKGISRCSTTVTSFFFVTLTESTVQSMPATVMVPPTNKDGSTSVLSVALVLTGDEA